MEYTTVQDFKIYAPHTGLDDTAIQQLITRGSHLLDAELGDNIGEQSITKRLDGYGKAKLIMENRITGVDYVKYQTGKQRTEVAVDFIDGPIIYLESILPIGDKNIEIRYTKGYTELPKDIQIFFHIYSTRLLQLDGYVLGTSPGEIKSKKINGLSISYKTPSELADAFLSDDGIFCQAFSNILDTYKNFSFPTA